MRAAEAVSIAVQFGWMLQADPSPDAVPLPPRYWWMKRLTMALFVWMALLIALRYVAAVLLRWSRGHLLNGNARWR